MELLNSTTLSSSQIFSGVSVFTPKFPITTWRNKKSLRFNRPNSEIPLLLPYSTSRNFRISAHFGRPTNRRNSLRKKLTEQQQVRPNPVIYDPNSDFQNPGHSFDHVENFQYKSDHDSVKQANYSSNYGGIEDVVNKLKMGESVPLNELEGWARQFIQDSEDWGIGFGPIFYIFQDSHGNVKRAVVNEDEILRRRGIEPSLYKKSEFEDLTEVKSKISHAKNLAREIESGTSMLSKNSSVAKYVVSDGQSGFVNAVRDVSGTLQQGLFPKLSRIWIVVLCGFVMFWATKRLFTGGKDKAEYTGLEKEMMRRKLKSRMEKEKLVKGSVEVIQGSVEPQMVSADRPKLDKEELQNSILGANTSDDKLASDEFSSTRTTESMDFNNKVKEIRAMARRAREIERGDPSPSDNNEDDQTVSELSNEKDVVKQHGEEVVSSLNDISNGYSGKTRGLNGTSVSTSFNNPKSDDISEIVDNSNMQNSDTCREKVPNDSQSITQDVKDRENDLKLSETVKVSQPFDTLNTQLCKPKKNSVRKQRVICLVEETKKFLSQTHENQEPEGKAQFRTVQEDASISILPTEKETDHDTTQRLDKDDKVFDPSNLHGTSDFTPATNLCEDPTLKRKESAPTQNNDIEDAGAGYRVISLSDSSNMKVSNDGESTTQNVKDREGGLNLSNMIKVNPSFDTANSQKLGKSSIRRKPRIIRSVKEARKFLSQKSYKRELNQEAQVKTMQEGDTVSSLPNEKATDGDTSQISAKDDKVFDPSNLAETSDLTPVTNVCEDSSLKEYVTTKINDFEAADAEYSVTDLQKARAVGHKGDCGITENEHSVLALPRERDTVSNTIQEMDKDNRPFQHAILGGPLNSRSAAIACGDSSLKTKASTSTTNSDPEDVEEGYEMVDHQNPGTSLDRESNGKSTETVPSVSENWIEKNFHDFEPVMKKIGVGFRDNYMVARDKVKQELNLNSEMIQPRFDEDDGELEWMKDDKLREIVFQVRENELAGRDPFYLIDDEDKLMFFEGLERKVEKESDKLLNLHEWLHSNIENLDYGADGISVYDSPDKIIPRWKDPQVYKNLEFLNNSAEQRKAPVAENLSNSYLVRDSHDSLQKSKESPIHENIPTTSTVYNQNTKIQDGDSRSPKTVIESSDGSVRTGKKSGKEYWQHTKKWSRGFLESYSAETDPETKAVMKDIGKDLDRWITEKEIQEAADLMTKLPERGKKFIEQKLNKVKREMELFGPQAVMSKYQEYAEEKEKDYLWWLDLPFVLCIELYTHENGEQKTGFYSLEMAKDLELDPKPYHVIAFEDPGDSKNLCCIIQTHMEVLGYGNAFVVARLPKLLTFYRMLSGKPKQMVLV
ncbi:uncharacterized protein LOC132298900 isoform X2 [Cornus florida]|uniref:uncharacterized protein LOC132298900 isoform X2 n=1 Tax=Cornus florida TaxID=4283 RepID=UPI0028A0FDBD|nr:uncharacterized protein LOC132298900 isoform X2 [Cornus florida]